MCLLGRAVEMLRALEMNEAIGEDLWMFSGPLLMALPAEATEKLRSSESGAPASILR